MRPIKEKIGQQSVSPSTVELILGTFFALVVFGIYSQVASHRTIPFDDALYLTSNAWVQKGLTWEGVVWAFSNVDAANWHPVAWISHMVDQELFGPIMGGHMIENVFWHCANCFLVYRLMCGVGVSRAIAFSMALVFACHPLNVESVAWLSQRKSQISTFMLLCTVLVYLDWRNTRKYSSLAFLVSAYVISLMAKAMGVSLPFILAIFEVVFFLKSKSGLMLTRDAVRQFTKTLLKRLAPLMLAAVTVAIATIVAQSQAGAVASIETLSYSGRLLNAISAFAIYIKCFFWPTELCFFYPLEEPLALNVVLGITLFLGVTVWTLANFSRFPIVIVGWGWFIFSLLPVIGLVQVGSQSHADRYMYFPMIGLLISLGSLFDSVKIPGCRSARAAFAGLTLTFAAGMGVNAYSYLSYWRTPEIAYRRALDVGGESYTMLLNLAATLVNLNFFKSAEPYAERAAMLWPDRPMAVANLATLKAILGKSTEAESLYRDAIILEPKNPEYRYKLGLLLLGVGENVTAEEQFQQALEYLPEESDWRTSHRLMRDVLLKKIPHSVTKSIELSEPTGGGGVTDLRIEKRG